MTDRVFRYVPLSRINAYFALGWVFACWPSPHSAHYVALMEWAGDGNPREPRDALIEQPCEEAAA